jgi:hypothetical protein
MKVTNVPEQTGFAEDVMDTLTGRFGLMFTVRMTCEEGPLQPFAVTWIFTIPKKPLDQVMIPVVAPILPAAPLLRLQLNPVLFVAVVA